MRNWSKTLTMLITLIIGIAINGFSQTKPVERKDEEFTARHNVNLEWVRKGDVDVMLLGDSITAGWGRNSAYLKPLFGDLAYRNFGIPGDRCENVLWRLKNGELKSLNPRLVVLMIGVNNIGAGHTKDRIVRGVKDVIYEIQNNSKSTRILLLGILPLYTKDNPKRQKQKAINSELAKLDDGKKIKFLDMEKAFCGADDELNVKYFKPDRLHLTQDGYKVWVKTMKPLVKKMLAEAKTDPAFKNNKKKASAASREVGNMSIAQADEVGIQVPVVNPSFEQTPNDKNGFVPTAWERSDPSLIYTYVGGYKSQNGKRSWLIFPPAGKTKAIYQSIPIDKIKTAIGRPLQKGDKIIFKAQMRFYWEQGGVKPKSIAMGIGFGEKASVLGTMNYFSFKDPAGLPKNWAGYEAVYTVKKKDISDKVKFINIAIRVGAATGQGKKKSSLLIDNLSLGVEKK